MNKCVKDSGAKSLLNTAEMYLHHRILHLYDLIDVFISPSRFLENKVKEMGFRNETLYLPYFINLEEHHPRYDWEENSIAYLGRLSREKGLFTLIEAMRGLPDIKLKIIGEGPLREALGDRVKADGIHNVEFAGYKTGEELRNEIRKSMAVVVPSEWYENLPFAVLEPFALGKSVIGARIGGIPELIRDNETGLTFESGNSNDLRSKIAYLANNAEKVVHMGHNARLFAEKELNAEKHYEELIEIYSRAIEKHPQA